MSQAALADQPARGPDGQLLDASKIDWYNDPDDPHPIQPISRAQEGVTPLIIIRCRQFIFLLGLVGQRSRPIRSTAGTRLAEVIAAEKLDEYGSSCRRFILPRDAKAPAKCKRPTTDMTHSDAIQVDSDLEDQTFAICGSDDDSLDSDSEDIEIVNEEVCYILSLIWFKLIKSTIKLADMLPSKTIPEIKSRKHRVSKHKTIKSTSAPAAHSRKKVRLTYSTEVEGEKGAHTGHSSASSFQVSYPVPVKVRAVS